MTRILIEEGRPDGRPLPWPFFGQESGFMGRVELLGKASYSLILVLLLALKRQRY